MPMDLSLAAIGLNTQQNVLAQILGGAEFVSDMLYTAVPRVAAAGTTATFTRATTATVRDNEGVLRTAIAGEARFEGARRVRNLQATSSEPTSGWTAAGATPPTVTYTTLDGSGAVSMAFPVVAAGYANSRCSGPVTNVSWVQNSTKIATQMVVSLSRALTGSEAITLYLAGASALDDVIVFNASNSPTSAVLQSAVDTFVNPTFSGTMGIIVYVSGAIVGSPITLSLTRIQFEDITAQTTQTAGEYVSVGVASAPYYHGSMVDGVRAFPNDLSGNPIPSTTLLGYSAEGARTNLCLQSVDLTNAAWTSRFAGNPSRTNNLVGPDGRANSGCTISNLGVGGVGEFFQAVSVTVADGVRAEPSFYAKAITTSGSVTLLNAYESTTGGNWTIDLSLLSTTQWERITREHPAVTINSEFTGSDATVLLNNIQLVWRTESGTADIALAFPQLELGSFASSYIPTTTVAVTRNADVLTYPSAGNIDGTKGWCYAEFDVANDSDGNQNIILGSDVAGVFPLYAQPSLGNVRTLDGINAPIAQSAPMSGIRKGVGTWGGSTLQCAHNGVVSTTTAFDGNMNVTSVVRVGEDNAGNSHLFGTIRNVRIGQRQLSASELQAITS